MNFNQFTIKSQEVIQKAQQLTQELGHQHIEPEHLFQAMLQNDPDVTPYLLKKLNVNATFLNDIVEKQLQTYPKVTGGEISGSRITAQVLNQALILAKNNGDEYASVAHLLWGLLEVKSTISQALKDQGVTLKDFKAAMDTLNKGASISSQSAEESFNVLNKYAKNLNELARSGTLDPVIGRDEEIRRILQILSRRTKIIQLWSESLGLVKQRLPRVLPIE